MKAIRYITAAAAALLLAACSQSEGMSDSYPSDGIVRVTTEVSHTTTRTDGYSTYEGTTMGLGIAYDNATTNPYNRPNVEWTRSSTDGTWTASSTMLWKSATAKTNVVYAYAPFQSNVSDVTAVPFTVNTDQSSASSYESDLVGYAKTGFVPSSDLVSGNIPVKFDHKCAGITIALTYGDEFSGTTPSIGSVTLKNANATVSYDATTATCGATSNPQSIKAYYEKNTGVYDVIVPAQTIAASTNLVRVMTVDGRSFYYTTDKAVELKAGYITTLNLRVGKDKITLNSVTVNAWDDNNGITYTIPGGTAKKQVITISGTTASVKLSNVDYPYELAEAIADADAAGATKYVVYGPFAKLFMKEKEYCLFAVNAPNVQEIDLSQVTGMTRLPAEAFKNQNYFKNFQKVTLPSSCAEIGASALFVRNSFELVAPGVTKIEENALLYFGANGLNYKLHLTAPGDISLANQAYFDPSNIDLYVSKSKENDLTYTWVTTGNVYSPWETLFRNWGISTNFKSITFE